MGNGKRIPFSQRVDDNVQAMMQSSGVQQNPNIPEQNLLPQGFEGQGLPIGSVGRTNLGPQHELSPNLDAALMNEATKEGLTGMTRLPEAAQESPTSRTEESFGIRGEVVPGRTPYLPLQSAAPSVKWSDRTVAMTLSMTPQGMRQKCSGVPS